MTDEFIKLIKFYRILNQEQRWVIRESMQTIGRNDIATDLRLFDSYESKRPEFIEAYKSVGIEFEARNEMEEFFGNELVPIIKN